MWILAEIVLNANGECEWGKKDSRVKWGSCELKMLKICNIISDSYAYLLGFSHLPCGIYRCHNFLAQLHITSIYNNAVIKLSKDNRGDTISQLDSIACVCFCILIWVRAPSVFGCCWHLQYHARKERKKNRKINTRKRQK